MSSISLEKAFRIAVSDKHENKLGTGGTSQVTARLLYYYAEGDQEGRIFVQALNGNFHPTGEKRSIESLDEFVGFFKPEPLVYFNRVKPAMDEARTNLEKGEHQLEKNRPDLAVKHFKKALAVDEDNIRGVFGLGLAYLAAGKNDDAEAILGKIMGLEMAFDPEHAHLFNQFGIKMRKAGMLDQALSYYNKALELSGDDEHLHFNVSRIHYDLGNLSAALESISKALSIARDFSQGLSMLKYLKAAIAFRDGVPATPPPDTDTRDSMN